MATTSKPKHILAAAAAFAVAAASWVAYEQTLADPDRERIVTLLVESDPLSNGYLSWYAPMSMMSGEMEDGPLSFKKVLKLSKGELVGIRAGSETAPKHTAVGCEILVNSVSVERHVMGIENKYTQVDCTAQIP